MDLASKGQAGRTNIENQRKKSWLLGFYAQASQWHTLLSILNLLPPCTVHQMAPTVTLIIVFLVLPSLTPSGGSAASTTLGPAHCTRDNAYDYEETEQKHIARCHEHAGIAPGRFREFGKARVPVRRCLSPSAYTEVPGLHNATFVTC